MYEGVNYEPAELRQQYNAWQMVVTAMSVL